MTAVGTLETNKTTGITGPEHKVTIKPELGTVFIKFQINASGGTCFTGSVLPVEVIGEVGGEANTTTHSHLTLNAANNGAKLLANGVSATMTATGTGFKKGTTTLVGAETF